jgi:hypothetical protein
MKSNAAARTAGDDCACSAKKSPWQPVETGTSHTSGLKARGEAAADISGVVLRCRAPNSAPQIVKMTAANAAHASMFDRGTPSTHQPAMICVSHGVQAHNVGKVGNGRRRVKPSTAASKNNSDDGEKEPIVVVGPRSDAVEMVE